MSWSLIEVVFSVFKLIKTIYSFVRIRALATSQLAM